MGNLKIVILFLVTVLLAGCLGTSTPEATLPAASATQPALASSTVTLDVTARYQQTLQANQTQNAASLATDQAGVAATGSARPPTATRTPTKMPTTTPWVVTPIPFIIETPTPLPTPSKDAGLYQLKAWDEASALELVEIAEQFSFADNIPKPFGEKRFDYQADQAVISLVAQEALHRFPEAGIKEKLEWRIALANTILGSQDSDAWILQKIEAGLNSAQFTPDTLNQMLNPFGFLIGARQSISNLFGDGRPVEILWITRLDRGYTGLYAALGQNEEGHYTLTKITSSWDFNFGYDGEYGNSIIETGDHTGDGVPEVILDLGYLNGSFCGYDLVIYQYLNGVFADISQDQFSFDMCNARDSWQFGSPDENGSQPIDTWHSEFFTGLDYHDRYEWNGERYALSVSELIPPNELEVGATPWIIYSMHKEDYPLVIEKVQQFLSAETQLRAAEVEYGVSYRDYLRFQLGLAYALQSNSTEARKTFDQIIQTPHNPLTTTLSNAAQAYLDNYIGDVDLYRACQASLKVMKQTSGLPVFNFDTVSEENLKPAWGYQPAWHWRSITLCDLSIALVRITAQLDGSQFTTAPTQLMQAGVLIRSAVDLDLNGDGQDEWILLADTPGDNMPVGIWILLNTSTNIVTIPVVSWDRKMYDLPLEDANSAELDVRTVISPEGETITFIQVGKHLYTFRLDAVSQSLDHFLWVMGDVETYTYYQRDDRLELEVIVNTEWCSYCKRFYRWDGHDFITFDPDEEKESAAEAALMTGWKPEEAIPLLQDILGYPDFGDSPRLMYLLGLAYELIGDEQNAVQTYWDLWHNYPESAYARLAQAKLELRR